MFDWSDNDEVLMAPSPSTTEPLRSMRVGDQSRGGEEGREPPTSGVPEQRVVEIPVQQTTEVPSEQTIAVPAQPMEVDPGS